VKTSRLFSLILAMCILYSCISITRAAGVTPTVSISSDTVKAGEDVTLTVSIKDNPGLAGYVLYIYYDTSVFENPSLFSLGSFQKSGGLITNTLDLAQENGRYEGLPGKDGVLALWYNSNGTDLMTDGDMLEIILTAKSNASNGDYSVSLGYAPSDCCNSMGNPVAFATGSGKVTVTGGATSGNDTSTTPNGTLDDRLFPDGVVPQFTDVSGHWAQKHIEDAAALGLIQGYNGLYRPNDTMTRAECVTILWRTSGCPTPTKKASFIDLDLFQKWYHEPVAWAEENGVVDGIGNGKFDPNGRVTREQLVTILHRMAGKPTGMELMFAEAYNTGFSDSGKISDWAKNALYWSIYNEIYCGVRSTEVGTALYPKDPANRAQIAVMMVRYLELIDK